MLHVGERAVAGGNWRMVAVAVAVAELLHLLQLEVYLEITPSLSAQELPLIAGLKEEIRPSTPPQL